MSDGLCVCSGGCVAGAVERALADGNEVAVALESATVPEGVVDGDARADGVEVKVSMVDGACLLLDEACRDAELAAEGLLRALLEGVETMVGKKVLVLVAREAAEEEGALEALAAARAVPPAEGLEMPVADAKGVAVTAAAVAELHCVPWGLADKVIVVRGVEVTSDGVGVMAAGVLVGSMLEFEVGVGSQGLVEELGNADSEAREVCVPSAVGEASSAEAVACPGEAVEVSEEAGDAL